MTVSEYHFTPIKQLKRLFLRTIGRFIPSDLFASRYPVSIKGICILDGKVILLKNEVGEWDLPGGKLEKGESPEAALSRELKEELNIELEIAALQAAFNIRIRRRINVLVVLYHCTFSAKPADLKMSYENFGLGFFTKEELDQLTIHPAYLPHLQASLH